MINIMKYLIVFLLTFLFIFLTFILNNFLKENVRYEVEVCDYLKVENLEKLHQLNYDLNYNKINKTLEVIIRANCCTEISVEKFIFNNEYLIFESGNFCTGDFVVMCYRKITIFDVDENPRIIFISGNRKRILSPNLEFCGFSTFGKCKSDSDCFISGCSSQVCQSKLEEPILTTCEYRDCYNYLKFNLSCKCIDNMCQWT